MEVTGKLTGDNGCMLCTDPPAPQLLLSTAPHKAVSSASAAFKVAAEGGVARVPAVKRLMVPLVSPPIDDVSRHALVSLPRRSISSC
eukprot:364111-Chlamydomonas_euryale.AAC.16